MKNKRSHNKKRNVGIIYEQLIGMVAKGIVDSDKTVSENASKIIKKYFKQGTELYKEYRLFKALVEPTIPDGSLATRILGEARKAARNHSAEKLNREKSKLIKEINYTFGKSFYSQKVENYTDFATVQCMLNDWRDYNPDIAMVNLYETKVHNILTKEKSTIDLKEEKSENVDNLIVKIMTEKFNKKYSSKLNEVQQQLIKQYVFYSSEGGEGFTSTLESIRENIVKDLNEYSKDCDNKHIASKITEVKGSIKSIDINELTDNTMSKFLLLCNLSEELRRNDHE